MKQFLNFNSLIERKKISGWGRKSFVESKFLQLESEQGIKDFIKGSYTSSLITRGLGRSYGDAAQLKENFILNVNFSQSISISGNQLTVGG